MIYFVRCEGHGEAVKIGTTESYRERAAQLKARNGKLELLGLMDGGYEIEQSLHERFASARIDEMSEWFNPTAELMDFISQNTHKNVPSPKKMASIKTNGTTDAVLDWIIFNHRATTGQGMTLDEALWYAYTHDVTEAVEAVLKTGAKPPIDERRESLKNRAEQRRKDNDSQQ